jgi:TolB-like protein/DNA-binding winged helix-turn-helix (wHTH) protein/Flp pilus assembly protein TadD
MEENTSAATRPASTGYQVDDLIVDLGQQRVTRAGIEIPLPHLSFDLLVTLACAAPDLVSFDELNKRVWPGLVITPETISQRVKLVRDALGDDSHAPRYIGGLRGRGYRMVASVRPLTNRRFSSEGSSLAHVTELIAAGTSPRDGAIAPSVLASRRMWWIGRAGAFAIAVLALALAYLLADRFWLSRNAANSQSTAATAQQTASATRVARPAINELSIAVLPFVDMSERKDQEYFSDGLSEELIELLGKTPGLRVIARTSSFYFKGRAEKLETIAEELRVANVLEGSVRKSGNRLRVTAQLIRADTSEHIWSETFDRDLHDVFKVQDEIASAVVTALRVHLLPMQQPAVQDELRTGNLEAYNQYLQGRQSYNQGDVVGYQRAVTAFRAAIALNSRYAAAYADLALAQFWLTSDTPADVAADVAGFDSALAAAEKAVALAPGLAAGYSARGFLRAVYRFDFAGALADLDKAVALSPGNASVLHRSAVLLAVLGDLPAAIAREEKALGLDPLSEEICMRLAFFFVSNQQLAQARPLYEKALAIAPNSTRARYYLGELDLLENRPEQALAAFRQTRLEAFSLTGQAKAEYSLGHVDVSRRVLEQLIAKYGKGSAHLIAEVYAWRGEKDQALEWAERAYVQRDIGITWLEIDTAFRSLRGDARYRALLREMNLPD